MTNEALQRVQAEYEQRYSSQQLFLRYPSENIIRLYNIFLKDNLPSGRVLDYGCGSGANSLFFIEKGYETYGVDVVDSCRGLISENLRYWRKDEALADRFTVVDPDDRKLHFEDNFFDLIVCHNALYLLGSEANVQEMCREFWRCLKPNGILFTTMMGPKHYWITHHVKEVYPGRLYQIEIQDRSHRLFGTKELVFLTRDERDLKEIFADFHCINIGYSDQSLFDQLSSFHWIYTGRKEELNA